MAMKMMVIALVAPTCAQAWQPEHELKTVVSKLAKVYHKESAVGNISCKDVVDACPAGYVHTDLRNNVSSPEQCCDATCAVWTCAAGWKSDPDYGVNIGKSNEVCCDRTCSNVPCPSGQGTIPSLADQPGTNESYCCADLCSKHTCYGSWVTDPSKAQVVGNTDEKCCQPSCQSVTCDATQGLVMDVSKADKAGSTSDQCCLKTCKYMSLNSQCQENYAIKPTVAADLKMTLPAGVNSSKAQCCSATCSAITCGNHTTSVFAYAEHFADSVSCCQATCAMYQCPHGWSEILANKDNAQGAAPAESCCERTCALFDCGLNDHEVGWFNSTDPSRLTSTVQSYENCCDPSCSGYTCPASYTLRANPATRPRRVENTRDTCCEPAFCNELRDNRSSMASDTNCNKQNQTQCDKAFWTFESEAGVKTYVPCIFKDTPFSLCRLDDTKITTGCSGM